MNLSPDQLHTIKEIIEERIFDRDCDNLYDRGAFWPDCNSAGAWSKYMMQINDRKQPKFGNITSSVPQHYIDLYCDLFID